MTLETLQAPTTHHRHLRHLSKVPEVTAYFWIVKVLTTGMGEAASDFLAHTVGPVLAVVVGLGGFVGSLWWQFRQPRYVAGVYWTAIAMISVFGTMAADGVHLIGVSYLASTVFFLAALGLVFTLWHRREGTLSIHSITSRHRERFYWLTVVTTFALGTAAGDWTANGLHLGCLVSGVVFAVLIAIPAVAHRWLGLGAIAAFWASYVVTRPLGASFADWMAVSPAHGGLGWGTGPVTLVFCVAIVGFVTYLGLAHTDVEEVVGEEG